MYRYILFVAFLSSACSWWQKSETKTLTPEDERALEEFRKEQKLGRDMAGRLLQFYGTYQDPKLLAYIYAVGTNVASNSDFPDRKYMFNILDDDSINAFACPGGYILITKGAIKAAQDEAQLAMIIGHEIAHVGKRHMLQALQKIGEKTAAEQEAALKKLDPHSKSRIRTSPSENTSAELLTRYLTQSGNIGLSFLQAAKEGMGVLLEKGLDKELEFEADQLGADYAIRASYHPLAFDEFFESVRLSKKKKSKKITATLDKTHPPLKSRRLKLMNFLQKAQISQHKGARGKLRFQSQTKLLRMSREGNRA